METIEILEGNPQVQFVLPSLNTYPDTDRPFILGEVMVRTGDAQTLVDRVTGNPTKLIYKNPTTLEKNGI